MSVDKLFLVISAVIETYCVNMFFKVFFKQRLENKKHILVILILCLIQIVNSYFRIDVLVLVISVLFTFAVAMLFNGNFITKVILSIVYTVDVAVCEYLVNAFIMIAFGINYVNTMSNPYVYASAGMVTKFLLFLTILITKLVWSNHKFDQYMDKKTAPFALVLPITTLAMLFMTTLVLNLVESGALKALFMISVVLLFVANIVNIELFERQSAIAKNQAELEFLKENMDNQIMHYQAIYDSQIEIRKIKHDSKNFFTAVLAQIRNGDIDSAEKVISESIDMLSLADNIVNTNHPTIDAIIQSKLNMCKQKRIKADIQYFYNQDILINEIELAVIIGNLFDNAIEANEKIADFKYINALIDVNNGEINITMTNPLTEPNPNLKTTKRDEEHHGLGIKSIKAIAQKYSGTANFVQENSVFNAYVNVVNK